MWFECCTFTFQTSGHVTTTYKMITKSITPTEFQKISDANLHKLNRSFDVTKFLEHYPDADSLQLIVMSVNNEYENKFYYRCEVFYHTKRVGQQDIFITQFDKFIN